jgi:enoyl-CoA hydratase/carnithine racemase
MAEVLTDLADGVLTVTLHRPSRLNALSVSLQRELAGLWARVRGDAGIRCIVLTGAGRAF